jgi:hypothetical protein
MTERIIELVLGQDAPDGFFISRIIATHEKHIGPGTNCEKVYTVVLEPLPSVWGGRMTPSPVTATEEGTA